MGDKKWLLQQEKIRQIMQELEPKRGMFFNIPPETGELLRFLARMTNARRVLEIGTANGYSSLWFCLAGKDVKITTIELDADKAQQARENFAKADVQKRVNLLLGDAAQLLPGIKDRFDLVFIDAVKEDYLKYFRLAYPKLNKGGLMAADDAVIFADAMKDYLQAVRSHTELESVLVTSGNGVEISWRKK